MIDGTKDYSLYHISQCMERIQSLASAPLRPLILGGLLPGESRMGLARALVPPGFFLLCGTLRQDAPRGADQDQATSMASEAAKELRRPASVGWLEAFPDPWLDKESHPKDFNAYATNRKRRAQSQ